MPRGCWSTWLSVTTMKRSGEIYWRSFARAGPMSGTGRQVLAACAVSWLESLRTRTPLLVFALLWSMLAPAWKVLTQPNSGLPDFQPHLGNISWLLDSSGIRHSGRRFTPYSSGLACSFTSFLYESLGKAFRSENVRRAFLLVLLIFLPVIGAAFELMNLYSFPGLVNDRLATTPLAQVAYMRMPADVLRFP